MKARIKKGMVRIELPLINPPRESKSGKTLLVANSRGPRRTALRVDGKPVVINVSAYVRPDGYVRETEISGGKMRRSLRPKQKRSKPKTHVLQVPHRKR
jgi:hypothetical protein